MKVKRIEITWLLLLLGGPAGSALADVRLPAIISNHMVCPPAKPCD